jgi:hypothetical protein
LFIWRNVAAFPPRRERAASTFAAGRDSLTGLAILLQRHLPEQSILASCLREREKVAEKRPTAAVSGEMRSLAGHAPSALPGFVAIQNLLHTKRKPI